MTNLKASVVIPAHNEEAVIFHSLSILTAMQELISLDIVVVCNDCTDDTVKIVQAFESVCCIETEVASKTHALNLGDDAAVYFPRFYLDADVRMTPEGIRDVVLHMISTGARAAAPEVQMDFSGCSWLVKSYYDIWCDLPYFKAGMIGAGVYVLSESGRETFDEFPRIIADDRYVRALFTEEQRTCAVGISSVVSAPTSIWGLVKIKSRSRLGGYEFESKFPQLITNEQKAYGSAVLSLVPKVHIWPKALVYLLVNLVSRLRATRQFEAGSFQLWERDDSSRDKLNS